jgi:hypothetical protein
MFDAMFCCLPARVGDEVDEVVSGHGRAGHGAFAVFFEVLDDESLLEKSEGERLECMVIVEKVREGQGWGGGESAFSKRRPVVLETTGCCGGEPLIEQARADMEGRRLGGTGTSQNVHSTPPLKQGALRFEIAVAGRGERRRCGR